MVDDWEGSKALRAIYLSRLLRRNFDISNGNRERDVTMSLIAEQIVACHLDPHISLEAMVAGNHAIWE